MRPSSMRVRMALLSVAIMCAVLIGLGATLFILFGTGVREGLDKLLGEDIETIERLLNFDADGNVELLWPSGNHQEDSTEESTFVIRTLAGKPLLKGGSPIELPELSLKEVNTVRDITIDQVLYRMRTRLHPKAHHVGPEDLVVQAARPLAPYQKHQHELAKLMLWLFPIPILVVALFSWFATTYSLRPLRRMIEKVQSMDAQRLHPRLPVHGNDEIGDLARTFNGFFERLQISFNALRRFTADASHELRTPLSVMRTQMEVALSRERTTPEYRSALGAALEDLARLQHLCELLLELARGDSGSIEVEFAEINVSELIEAWVERFLPVAEEKNIRLTVTVARDIVLNADRRLLEIIVVNLLNNALTYTPEAGKIEINLQVKDSLMLSVQDTGPGIPEEDRERIFERFVRLSSTRRSANGAGLGLALVKWAVEAHQGEVYVQSAQVGGSEFIVLLPLR